MCRRSSYSGRYDRRGSLRVGSNDSSDSLCQGITLGDGNGLGLGFGQLNASRLDGGKSRLISECLAGSQSQSQRKCG